MNLARRASWRAATASASRWLADASYLQKWLVLGVLIGAMAGVGAIVAREQIEHAQICPGPGLVEHDALEIWRNVQACVSGALATSASSVPWSLIVTAVAMMAVMRKTVMMIALRMRITRQ